ncbi:MAG: hypothetical protein ACI9EW_003127, partial [Cellvibrionaceae bacterium]
MGHRFYKLQTSNLMIHTHRPPSEVMKLSRLGAFHQTRLSFVRSLLRKVMREQWQIARTLWDLDK